MASSFCCIGLDVVSAAVHELNYNFGCRLLFFDRGFFTPPVPRPETLPKLESSSARSPGSPLGPTIVEVTEVSTVTTVGDVEDEVTSDLSAPTTGEPEPWLEPPAYEVATSRRNLAPTSAEVDAWLEPPSCEVGGSPKAAEAPSSAMLEAFHQFQHNPQVQGMVVSLATDKGVWDAVLANEKIKEFRRNFSAPTCEDSLGGAMDQKVKHCGKNANVFSLDISGNQRRRSRTSFLVFKSS